MTDDLSTKMRSYLAEVYRLREREQPESGYVPTSSLADVLYVTAPAVNRMVSRLKEMDYLYHEPYQGVRLTETGEQIALRQIRAHRIAEAFLVTVMGFAWHEIYQEATRMSHALSDALLDRMAAMCGNPRYCPHGEPIPKADGSVEAMNDTLLSEIEIESQAIITRIRTREPDRLKYIQALGLIPGTHLEVIHRAPFDGPMQLKIDGEYRIIGHTLAELIRARPN